MVSDDNKTKFDTGAVRSADAKDVRYDLITPIGLEAVARAYAEGVPQEKSVPLLLSECLRETYIFLSGDRNADHLANAARALLQAIQETSDAAEEVQGVREGEAPV
jgi:hypothetical protein